jgi:hypothetical protein
METKKQISQQEQLIQARQKQLENLAVGSLRSHGKLWGMDVFSWFKPNVNELENTISSFPFPVCWFSNEDDVLSLINENNDWISNIKLLCTYDKAGYKISNKSLDTIETVLGAKSLTDALELLKVLKIKQSVLLFTCNTENWKEVKDEFDAYISFHQ